MLLHNLLFGINIYNDSFGYRGYTSYLYSYKDIIIRLFHIVTRMTDNEPLLGGFWFLKSLFIGSIIGYLGLRYLSKRLYLLELSLLIIVSLGFWQNLSVPYFQIGAKDVFAALFFVLGYHCKRNNILTLVGIHNHIHIPFIIVTILLITLGTHYWQGTVKVNMWWKVVPYTATAILGTISVYILSLSLRKIFIIKKFLVYVGNHTMDILIWHMIAFKIVSFVIIKIYCLDIRRLAEHPAIEEYAMETWWSAYLIVGVFAPLLLSKIVEKWEVVKK